MGIYYNLSVWYKLSEKTKYGAFLSIFGSILTLGLNFILIPVIGFVGSAWTTLVCYFSMTIMSYYFGQKHYQIPYQIKRILFYLGFMITLFFSSIFFYKGMIFNVILVLLFIIVAYILEKPKKTVISSPELFD